jgi:fluoroacetyl-CoA thioesterase
MKDTLKPGLTHEFRFTVPEDKTVPRLYPESALFQQMPHVFATGFMVGLLEWACIDMLRKHLDWPRLEKVEGRKLTFLLSAHDGVDLITEGQHERHVIDAARFDAN